MMNGDIEFIEDHHSKVRVFEEFFYLQIRILYGKELRKRKSKGLRSASLIL